MTEVTALDVFHDDIRVVVRLTDVEDLNDVRMVELPQNGNLATYPFHLIIDVAAGTEGNYLDSDLPPDSRIFTEVDGI